jgi:glycosyltransferase involved in cell wall biosynthesis
MTPSTSESNLLSIIIPTYNYANPVRVAVYSVLEQINEVCELIVIDDGSRDETPAVLAAITPPPALQCRFIHQENAGPAAARNHGLRLSTGKFILFLDADDELLPGAVDAVLKAIQAHPEAGLILGAHIDRFPNGREKLVLPTPIYGDISQRLSDYLFRKKVSIQHGACVFCRNLLERRPYPERLRQTEDIPVFAYLVAHAIPILVPEPLARINKHSGSLRHNPEHAKASHQMLIEELFSTLPDESQHLRTAYEAKRTLSVFRICYEAGDFEGARRYYRMARLANWRQALRWKYLSKYLRLLFRDWRQR